MNKFMTISEVESMAVKSLNQAIADAERAKADSEFSAKMASRHRRYEIECDLARAREALYEHDGRPTRAQLLADIARLEDKL